MHFRESALFRFCKIAKMTTSWISWGNSRTAPILIYYLQIIVCVSHIWAVIECFFEGIFSLGQSSFLSEDVAKVSQSWKQQKTVDIIMILGFRFLRILRKRSSPEATVNRSFRKLLLQNSSVKNGRTKQIKPISCYISVIFKIVR